MWLTTKVLSRVDNSVGGGKCFRKPSMSSPWSRSESSNWWSITRNRHRLDGYHCGAKTVCLIWRALANVSWLSLGRFPRDMSVRELPDFIGRSAEI